MAWRMRSMPRLPVMALSDEIDVRSHVGDWAKSGHLVLSMSFVVRDPSATCDCLAAASFLGQQQD
jgi:hypothetical protein